MDFNTYGVTEVDPLEVPPLTPTSKEVLSQAVRASFSGFTQERLSQHFPQDPTLWSQWEVNHWLDWCSSEFGLQCLGSDLKGLQGSELCSLDREAFLGLMSDCTAGEILWAHLEIMRRENECDFTVPNISKAENYSAYIKEHSDSVQYCPRLTLTETVPHQDVHLVKPEDRSRNMAAVNLLQEAGGNRDSEMGIYREQTEETMSADIFTLPRPHRSFKEYAGNQTDLSRAVIPATVLAGYTGSGPIQLWQFLLELLTDHSCRACISWTGDGWEFKLTDPDEVAFLWGRRKNKPKMNYEKLSRGLRYYYDKNIIRKTAGKRYVYRFVCNLQGLLGYEPDELHAMMDISNTSH